MLSSKGCPQTLDQTSFPKKDQRPGELKTKRAPKRALNTSAFLRGQVAGCGTSRTDNHSLSVGSACRREFNMPSKVEPPTSKPGTHFCMQTLLTLLQARSILPTSTSPPGQITKSEEAVPGRFPDWSLQVGLDGLRETHPPLGWLYTIWDKAPSAILQSLRAYMHAALDSQKKKKNREKKEANHPRPHDPGTRRMTIHQPTAPYVTLQDRKGTA